MGVINQRQIIRPITAGPRSTDHILHRPTGVATEFFFLFEIPKFADTWLFQTLVADGMGLTFEQFEAPMDFIHKQGGAYLVWLLILGHAAAALYHHYHLKDRTLLKMLPPRR